MSPYCPRCFGVSVRSEARCPLDQQFLHRRSCAHCGDELFPRELFCAQCGEGCREPKESLLLPAEAQNSKVLGSLFLDYFTVSLLLGTLLWHVVGPWILPTLPVFGLLYRAAGRSGGRQTFGQSVFLLLSLDLRAGPAGFVPSLRRSFWELWLVPKSLFRPRAWNTLEERTSTMEVSLA